MSHAFIFRRFEGGRFAAIPQEALVNVLNEHGFGPVILHEGMNELRAPIDETGDTPIGDVNISVKAGSVIEFCIDRPRYRLGFRALSFNLVKRLCLVMFASDGSAIYACPEGAAELPEGFGSNFKQVNLDVQMADHLP